MKLPSAFRAALWTLADILAAVTFMVLIITMLILLGGSLGWLVQQALFPDEHFSLPEYVFFGLVFAVPMVFFLFLGGRLVVKDFRRHLKDVRREDTFQEPRRTRL